MPAGVDHLIIKLFNISMLACVCFSQLPEQYRLMHIQPPKKKSKHKHKHHRLQDPLPQGMTRHAVALAQNTEARFQASELLLFCRDRNPIRHGSQEEEEEKGRRS